MLLPDIKVSLQLSTICGATVLRQLQTVSLPRFDTSFWCFNAAATALNEHIVCSNLKVTKEFKRMLNFSLFKTVDPNRLLIQGTIALGFLWVLKEFEASFSPEAAEDFQIV